MEVLPSPHIITSSTYTVWTTSKQLKLFLKQKIHKETLVDFAVFESTVKKCYKEIIRWFLLQWNSCNKFNRNYIDRRKNNTTRHCTNLTRYLKRAFIKNPALGAVRQAWSAISRGNKRTIQNDLESNDLPAWDSTGLQSDEMNKKSETKQNSGMKMDFIYLNERQTKKNERNKKVKHNPTISAFNVHHAE